MLENYKGIIVKRKNIKHFFSILYNIYVNVSYASKFLFVSRKRSTSVAVSR